MVCTHNHFFDGRRNFMRGYLNDKGLKKMLKRNKLRDKVMSAGFNTFLDDNRQISIRDTNTSQDALGVFHP